MAPVEQDAHRQAQHTEAQQHRHNANQLQRNNHIVHIYRNLRLTRSINCIAAWLSSLQLKFSCR